jgi:MFS transporter, DHA2 family, multidrug resistance protein
MLMANMFLLPIFMQELLGFSAVQSGLSLMPRTLIMMVAVPLIGRAYNFIPPRVFLVGGVVLFALSSWQLSHLTLAVGTMDIIVPLIIQGTAFACLFVPLSTIALSNVPRHRMADATGLNSLVRQIGGAIGLAVFATLIGHYATQARAGITAHVVATRPEVWQQLQVAQHGLMARGMDAASAATAALQGVMGSVYRQSMVLSFDKIFLMAGLLFLLVLPVLYFLRMAPHSDPGARHDVHVEI